VKALASLIALLAIPLEGFCISKLWGWFVAAKFELPAINTAEGIGLALLLTIATYQYSAVNVREQDDAEAQLERSLSALFVPLVAVAFGFIVKGWA
jgi:hypothetical protein